VETHRLTLSATPPFSFAQTLAFIRSFYARDYERVPAHEQVVGNTLRRIVSVQGVPVLFEVEAQGAGLELTLHAERLSDSLLAATTERVRFYLGLDDDLEPLYSRADPIFQGVVQNLYGYHMLKILTPFEAACWALIQQRTPNGFAHKTMARLAEHFGGRLTYGDKTYVAFPEARQMLQNPQARILEATNNTRKTERLLHLVGAFAGADETFLRAAPYGEVAHWIGGIKGLGAWSVDFIALRGLGRTERVPWTDTGMLEAIAKVYTQGFEISAGNARELAERYGWYQGLWAHYVKTAAFGAARRKVATLDGDVSR
jgi:DNA-3-methyladenine glycosylase II